MNPIIMKKIVLGIQSMVMRKPIISSMTILGSSFLPKDISAFSEIQAERKKKPISVIS